MKYLHHIIIVFYLVAALAQDPYHDITEGLSSVPGNITLCSEPYDEHETYKVFGDMHMNGYNVSIMPKITLIIEGNVYREGGSIVLLHETAYYQVTGQIYD